MAGRTFLQGTALAVAGWGTGTETNWARTDCRIQVDSFGGALARVAPDATAFPHRAAKASVQVYVNVLDGRTEAEGRRIVASLRDGLGLGTTGYVNYIDPEMPDWPTAYYGRNLARLRKVA